MAGLDRNTPTPTEIKLHQASHLMEISFSDGENFTISYELMRVYSPSAEVRGHGPGQEVLQTGKREVLITALDPVGNYAVKPTFSDGHDTGIFSWDLLYDLGLNQEQYWEDYLSRLKTNCAKRETENAPAHAHSGGGCGCSSAAEEKPKAAGGCCGGGAHSHDDHDHGDHGHGHSHGGGGCGGGGGGCGSKKH